MSCPLLRDGRDLEEKRQPELRRIICVGSDDACLEVVSPEGL